jgi:hypothetical protein
MWLLENSCHLHKCSGYHLENLNQEMDTLMKGFASDEYISTSILQHCLEDFYVNNKLQRSAEKNKPLAASLHKQI